MLNELGSAHTEAGRFDEALRDYARSLEIFERVGQGESSNAAIALNNQCGTLHLAGREREAEACARRSAALRQKLYGPSLNSAAVQLLLGQILIGEGEPKAALVALGEGLEMVSAFVDPESGIVYRVQLARAQALADAARIDEAEALVQTLSDGVDAHPALGAHFRGLVLIERTRAQMLRGRLDEARSLLSQAEPLIRTPHANLRDDLALFEALQRKIKMLGDQENSSGRLQPAD